MPKIESTMNSSEKNSHERDPNESGSLTTADSQQVSPHLPSSEPMVSWSGGFRRARRYFSDEKKREIVQFYANCGSLSRASRQFNLGRKTIRSWVRAGFGQANSLQSARSDSSPPTKKKKSRPKSLELCK